MNQEQTKYLNVNGRLLDLSTPCVMGILNVTPDSFYSGSRMQTEGEIEARVRQILEEGAAIIDVGAYSSRPNADHVSAEEEMNRLRLGLDVLRRTAPDAIVSVDTFRADVARMCVEEYGVAIINDIAAGEMDADMFSTVVELNVPYIMMHMQGTPQNMQQHPHYDNLLREVFLYFARKVQQLRDLGVKDIVLDPGFGFGKTLEHNYQLMAHLEEFRLFELPLIAGHDTSGGLEWHDCPPYVGPDEGGRHPACARRPPGRRGGEDCRGDEGGVSWRLEYSFIIIYIV